MESIRLYFSLHIKSIFIAIQMIKLTENEKGWIIRKKDVKL